VSGRIGCRFWTDVHFADVHSGWHEEIAGIDPVQSNKDPPQDYVSVVNKLSERLFSLQKLWIRLSQRLLAPV
jgi:hypothetical protein